jgi:hypothetical protein
VDDAMMQHHRRTMDLVEEVVVEKKIIILQDKWRQSTKTMVEDAWCRRRPCCLITGGAEGRGWC